MSQVRGITPTLGAADVESYIRRGPDRIAELHLAVDNMHCAGCMAKIEAALRDQPGVDRARVNLSTRRLALRFDPGQTRAETLMGRVEALGYRCVPFDPDTVGQTDGDEERRLLIALAVAGFAAGNVMLLSVAVWAGSDMGPATRDLFHWLSALIALPAVAFAGRPFYRSALTALRAGTLNMDVPISLAVLLAAGMSLYETMNGGAHAYFDASVTLLFFLLVGRYLDRRARGQASEAVEQLMMLGAVQAQVIDEGGERRALPIGQVRPGMRVWVAPGDRVPVDGTVVAGRSELDNSLVTGESRPITVRPGDAAYAGTLNLSGALEITVRAAGEATLLAEIAHLMEAAQQGRARYVRLADRVARIYAPVVHLLALATFLGWFTLTDATWQQALLTAVAVLIITCPCALGLAVPVVQVVASGWLFRRGVLVKAGDALERLTRIDTVVFDKTGTLTLGQPELCDPDTYPPDLLHLAARIAAASRHPLAQALVRAAGAVENMAGVTEVPGMGLEAMIDGQPVRIGSRRWCGVAGSEDGYAAHAGSELWLARPGEAPCGFRFQDRLRADASRVIAALRGRGLEVEMLSGDRAVAVAPIAQDLGISEFQAELAPNEKVARVQELTRRGRCVLMVGDGLNDAPALAAARASISPSSAADVSRTAADIVFQGDDLTPVLWAIDTARIAGRLAKQNFALALLYNLFAIPLAVAGLATPLMAAVAMSLSSLAVTVNALRFKIAQRVG